MAKQDLNKLIEKCQSVMTDLELALKAGNVRAGQRIQGQAETLRDALESKMTPQDLELGANFLQTKGQLDDAIVKASAKLDPFDNLSYNSGSRFGVFDNSSYAEHEGNVHVNDLDFKF